MGRVDELNLEQKFDRLSSNLLEHIQEENKMHEEQRKALQKQGEEIHALRLIVVNYIEKRNEHLPPCEALRDSIPNEDFAGHREYHEGRMSFSDRMTDFKWFVIKTVCGSIATSFVIWIGFLAWAGFLKGPVAHAALPAVTIQQSSGGE